MFFKKNPYKKEIEKALNEIQMNLENNYKDLAIKAFKDADILLKEHKEAGKINDKDYEKYAEQMKVFSKRMEGYSHRLNVKFLGMED